jgi:hypothetical protein
LAVLITAQSASAQKIVVLDFKGDSRGRIRAQVEARLRAQGAAVISLRKYKDEALLRGVAGARSGSSAAVAKMSRVLGLIGVVKGQVARGFHVVVVDASGKEALARDYPVSKRLLSDADASSLAASIADALKAAAKPSPPAPQTQTPAAPGSAAEAKPEPIGQTLPELDLSPDLSKKGQPPTEKRIQEEAAESRVASEAGEPERKPEATGARTPAGAPKLLTLQLTGLSTWRRYCSRPGVSRCQDYDSQSPAQRAPGDTVDFNASSPYFGISFGLEFFPLPRLTTNRWLAGIGLSGSYGRGFSNTNISVQGGTAQTVKGADSAISLLAVYRFYFALSLTSSPLAGYVGLHGGLGSRSFTVDATPGLPPLNTHRTYPQIGIEASIPIFSFLKVEAAGDYFLGPKVSQSDIGRYGTAASGSGFGFEAGLAGDVWGPLGYTARFKYASYTDAISGAGASWQNGGAAEESYSSIVWGITASF